MRRAHVLDLTGAGQGESGDHDDYMRGVPAAGEEYRAAGEGVSGRAGEGAEREHGGVGTDPDGAGIRDGGDVGDEVRGAVGDPGRHSVCAWYLNQETRETATYRVGARKAMWTSRFCTVLFRAEFGLINMALWLRFKRVVNGKISSGELTAFQSYIFQIGAGLGSTSWYITQL